MKCDRKAGKWPGHAGPIVGKYIQNRMKVNSADMVRKKTSENRMDAYPIKPREVMIVEEIFRGSGGVMFEDFVDRTHSV
jgi:hypothetical protein